MILGTQLSVREERDLFAGTIQNIRTKYAFGDPCKLIQVITSVKTEEQPLNPIGSLATRRLTRLPTRLSLYDVANHLLSHTKKVNAVRDPLRTAVKSKQKLNFKTF